MPGDRSQFVFLLNEHLAEEERIFKLKEAVLTDETLTVRLLYPKERAGVLSDALKDKVFTIARAALPSVFDLKLEYIRTYSDESTVRTKLMELLYKEAVLVYPKLKNTEPKIDFEPFTVKITLSVPDYSYRFCCDSGLKDTLEKRLSENFMEDFEVTFLPREETVSLERAERTFRTETIKTVRIEYDIGMLHFGMITRDPRYIKDVVAAESDSETVCGTISNFVKRTSKSNEERKFYTFRLNDTTGTIEVKFFPRVNSKQCDIFDLLKDGSEIAAEGSIRRDSFSRSNVMFLRSFTACKIDRSSIDTKIEYLGLPKDYFRIRPQPYVERTLERVDFFSMDDALPEQLLKKTFVVFDFETTGLAPGKDSPIEIGAVKIENGVLTETFSTFIKPIYPEGRTSLGSEIVNLTGITDDMVQDAPEQKDICGDVYKFFYGSTLVAHNADFDMAFLKKMGDDNFYNFDNEYLDTLKLSREKTRYSKHTLEYLCDRFGIDIGGAHRAVNDATATAKLFLKLVKQRKDGGKTGTDGL